VTRRPRRGSTARRSCTAIRHPGTWRSTEVDWGEAACGSLDWARALAAVEYRMRELTAVAPIREPAPVVATLAGFALREYLHWVSADLDPEDGRATRIRTTKTAQFAAVLAWAAELLHLDPPMFGSPTPPRSAS
jgi:hypothetical protein